MTAPGASNLADVSDAELAGLLCAIDPCGFGGILARGRAGPSRDHWLAGVKRYFHPETPFRRLPLHASDERIFGGLDLPATLEAGRPVATRGLVAETDGGIILISMAERLTRSVAARLGQIMDTGTLTIERDGIAEQIATRFGCIALDEGVDADERPPSGLCDRLAFWVDLNDYAPSQTDAERGRTVSEALRVQYRGIELDDGIRDALAESALALGVSSLRASIMVLRAPRACAAVAGRSAASREDAAVAARLVLAPRATRLPASAEQRGEPPPPSEDGPAPSADSEAKNDSDQSRVEARLADQIVDATRAAIPPDLLARLQSDAMSPSRQQEPGRAGPTQLSAFRGRPIGTRRGTPGGRARLDVIATLRAAAPWQRLRAAAAAPTQHAAPVAIRRDDFRLKRFAQRAGTTTIFVVDASGSLAANRLAEAKGAVELLLADCYVRRDHVALLAFRERDAQLLLPPTRSLARAKRSLAQLPGGGATPLARAIDAAMDLADQVKRRGQTPVVVLMTDGRGNVARDGTPGRQRADEDARIAARAAAIAGHRVLVLDAAPRPQQAAREIATAMKALYLPLPRADATALSRAVSDTTPVRGGPWTSVRG